MKNLTNKQLLLVEMLQEEFEPAELGAIYAHIQGANETNGPAVMRRLIEAAFAEDFKALGVAMEEAGV